MAASETLVFWLVASLMTVLALAFAIPRLLTRRPPSARRTRSAINAAICRSELADLERERAEGRMTDAEYRQARDDAQRRLLADTSIEVARRGVPSPSRALALAMCIGLPALAFGLYAIFGDPAALDRNAPSGVATGAHRDALARHLARHPDDARGWVLLARSDFEAERFADAAASYRRALATSTKTAADPGLWCELAGALGMARGGTLAGEPRELVARALALDPDHPKALEMAGSAAFEQGEFAAAATSWRRLLLGLPPGGRSRRELAAAIARAEDLAGTPVASQGAVR
jgi:cytochrome c-type biogenesis protein CcmH